MKNVLDEESLKELISIIQKDITRLDERIDDINVGDISKYDGAYVVTPMTDSEIALKTSQRYMTEDVVVKKIPYYETTNESNGETVYIGSEV